MHIWQLFCIFHREMRIFSMGSTGLMTTSKMYSPLVTGCVLQVELQAYCTFFLSVVLLCAADPDEHRILSMVQEAGMLNPDYLYITLDHLPPGNIRTPWGSNTHLMEVYKYIIQVNFLLCSSYLNKFKGKHVTKPKTNNIVTIHGFEEGINFFGKSSSCCQPFFL